MPPSDESRSTFGDKGKGRAFSNNLTPFDTVGCLCSGVTLVACLCFHVSGTG